MAGKLFEVTSEGIELGAAARRLSLAPEVGLEQLFERALAGSAEPLCGAVPKVSTNCWSSIWESSTIPNPATTCRRPINWMPLSERLEPSQGAFEPPARPGPRGDLCATSGTTDD